jgi:2-phosphoglycolate phosphatase
VSSSVHPLRAVLFDFDGTLGDSYVAITASVNHVRAFNGLPPLSEAEVRPHVGRGPDKLLDSTVGRGSLAENLAEYRRHHVSVMRQGTRLLSGAELVLRALHDRGIRSAICSNKPVAFTRNLLRWLGIAEFLELVLGPEDVPRPKPAPDMLLEALRRLNVRAEEAIYVGDMTVDVDAARAAGIEVWVVATGSDDRTTLAAAKPDRLLSGLDEIPGTIARAFP